VPGDSVFFSGEWLCHSRTHIPPGDRPRACLITPGPGISVSLNPDNIQYYKTMIELEGNSVVTKAGNIYINGKKMNTYQFREKYYFVAGENLPLSYDSRHWGFLPLGAIQGKVIFKLWSK
jgi:signal peptidase I